MIGINVRSFMFIASQLMIVKEFCVILLLGYLVESIFSPESGIFLVPFGLCDDPVIRRSIE